MKKTIWQKSIWLVLFELLFASICLFPIIGLILYIPQRAPALVREGRIDEVVVELSILAIGSIVLFVICLDAFILVNSNRLIIYDDKLLITGNFTIFKKKRNEVVQARDEIKFEQIQDIKIICVCLNSRKKTSKTAKGIAALRPYVYFEFVLSDGETKWMYIEFFSKKQRQKILDIINEKTGLNFSYKDLKREDRSIFARKKKPGAK